MWCAMRLRGCGEREMPRRKDGITDPIPVGVPNWPFPIHMIGIAGMGIHLVDNMALRALGAACAERNRWEFLFMLSPLRVVGGTGCPVNPLAVL